MTIDIEQSLKAMGLAWPQPPKPVASYVPAVRSGSLLFISGQLPLKDGALLVAGKVPSAVPLERAQAAAAQCALNAMAIVRAELGGDWSRLVRIVRVGVFIECDDGFTEQARVANGASDFLVKLLGEAGRHARTTLGMCALPLNTPVELEMILEVR